MLLDFGLFLKVTIKYCNIECITSLRIELNIGFIDLFLNLLDEPLLHRFIRHYWSMNSDIDLINNVFSR